MINSQDDRTSLNLNHCRAGTGPANRFRSGRTGPVQKFNRAGKNRKFTGSNFSKSLNFFLVLPHKMMHCLYVYKKKCFETIVLEKFLSVK